MPRPLLISILVAMLLASPAARAQEAAGRASIFRVEGITCALCGRAIDKSLRRIAGVQSVVIDQEAERVTILADATISTEQLQAGIESAGSYEAELLSQTQAPRQRGGVER